MEKQAVEIFGVKELDEFFQELSRADQRKIIMNSFRTGSKPLVTTARALLKSKLKTRSKTNNLSKSIGFVAGRSRGKSVFVTAKVGARKFGRHRGFHGHLYDAGTAQRSTKRGFSRGEMPASGFFTNALQQTESSMVNLSQNDYMQALEKLINSKLRRQKKAASK